MVWLQGLVNKWKLILSFDKRLKDFYGTQLFVNQCKAQ
jgi:hypothetical protein